VKDNRPLWVALQAKVFLWVALQAKVLLWVGLQADFDMNPSRPEGRPTRTAPAGTESSLLDAGHTAHPGLPGYNQAMPISPRRLIALLLCLWLPLQALAGSLMPCCDPPAQSAHCHDAQDEGRNDTGMPDAGDCCSHCDTCAMSHAPVFPSLAMTFAMDAARGLPRAAVASPHSYFSDPPFKPPRFA
jgi:hypothetical protein